MWRWGDSVYLHCAHVCWMGHDLFVRGRGCMPNESTDIQSLRHAPPGPWSLFWQALWSFYLSRHSLSLLNASPCLPNTMIWWMTGFEASLSTVHLLGSVLVRKLFSNGVPRARRCPGLELSSRVRPDQIVFTMSDWLYFGGNRCSGEDSKVCGSTQRRATYAAAS